VSLWVALFEKSESLKAFFSKSDEVRMALFCSFYITQIRNKFKKTEVSHNTNKQTSKEQRSLFW